MKYVIEIDEDSPIYDGESYEIKGITPTILINKDQLKNLPTYEYNSEEILPGDEVFIEGRASSLLGKRGLVLRYKNDDCEEVVVLGMTGRLGTFFKDSNFLFRTGQVFLTKEDAKGYWS